MIDIVNYNKNIIPIGQSGRVSLNLKDEQEVYVYEDFDNAQLILSPYELKRSLYRSTIIFDDIDKYIEFSVDISSRGLNISSIDFYYSGKYRINIVFEIMEEHQAFWKKAEIVKTFRWDEIPGNDNKRLIEFLNQKFDIDWVKAGQIKKTKENTIKVFTEKNFLLLKLNDEKSKVDLEIDDGRKDELIAKKEKDINIYAEITSPAEARFREFAKTYEIELVEFIDYSDKTNLKIKNLILPLIDRFGLNKKILRHAKISKNYTIYHDLSEEFKKCAKEIAKIEKFSKCIQICESDIGILIIKFYESDIERIIIHLLNLPGSFARLMNVCKAHLCSIEAIELQRISFEVGGIAKTMYLLRFNDDIRKELPDDKIERKKKIKELINKKDSELKDSSHQKLINLHNNYLKRLKKENVELVADIEIV